MEKTADKPIKVDQIYWKSYSTKKHNLNKTPNNTILGAEANNIVTDRIDPS
jgi:hypothetical protein